MAGTLRTYQSDGSTQVDTTSPADNTWGGDAYSVAAAAAPLAVEGVLTGSGSLAGALTLSDAATALALVGILAGSGSLAGVLTLQDANAPVPLAGVLSGGGALAGLLALEDLNIALSGVLSGGGSLSGALAVLELPFTKYLGHDLLEVQPDGAEAQDERWRRSGVVLDHGTGVYGFRANGPTPVLDRPFRWVCFGRGEVEMLRRFLRTRRGRLVPCWVPSWRRDLVLGMDAPAASAQLRIRATGYTARLFPHAARRDLALIPPSGAVLPRRVTAAVDNGDGTETLTLSAPHGVDLLAGEGAGSVLVSFLSFARLADDAAEITWQSQAVAECALRFTELPREVPSV
jgi:hypothetical protein